MITRRRLIAAGIFTPFSMGAALAVTQPSNSALRVIADGREVGEFLIKIEDNEDGIGIHVDIDLDVRGFLDIPLYRYTLSSYEVWSEGRLEFLKSETKAGGKTHHVTAEEVGDHIEVDGSRFQGRAPRDAGTTSYFSRDLLKRPVWISTIDGRLHDVQVRPGRKIQVSGIDLQTSHLDGDLDSEVFYTADGRWGGAIFNLKGRTVQVLPGVIGPRNLRLR